MDALAVFDAAVKRLMRAAQQSPSRLGWLMVQHYKMAFSKGGYTDESFSPWRPRKHNYGTPVLVRTGNLRDSIKAIKDGPYRVRVVATAPYAQYVNKDRPFMAPSRKLDRKLRDELEKTLVAAFNK